MTDKEFQPMDSPQDQPGLDHAMEKQPDYTPRYPGSGRLTAQKGVDAETGAPPARLRFRRKL